MAVLVLVVTWSLQGLARAQAESDEVPVILLHPGVPTTLRLPEEIEQARILDRGEVRLAIVRDTLYLRPWPGTRAGTRAVLEVKSRTVLRRIPVRVVRHAREAHFALQMGPAGRLDRFQAPPEFPRVALLRPPILFQEPPAPAAPPVSVTAHAPGPALPPAPVLDETPEAATPEQDGERAAVARHAPRIQLSLHAFGAILGTTAVDVAGYESINGRRSHRAFGLRVAGSRHDTWWAVEVNVSGEWPAAPTRHRRGPSTLHMSGPWLRADVGIRGRFGSGLMPTFYAGGGLQAHFQDIARTPPDEFSKESSRMPFGGVLALGVGLEYRTAAMLAGLELHVRQGVPSEYRSVAALLSVGFFLDQGE